MDDEQLDAPVRDRPERRRRLAVLRLVTLVETDLCDVVSLLLARVIDSFEKLEVVVHLYRTRFRPQTSLVIARTLQLPAGPIVDTLGALLRAGVVRTSLSEDETGWWFDPNGQWAHIIESLVELYDIDRSELLRSMKKVAFQGVRSTLTSRGFHFPRNRKTPEPS